MKTFTGLLLLFSFAAVTKQTKPEVNLSIEPRAIDLNTQISDLIEPRGIDHDLPCSTDTVRMLPDTVYMINSPNYPENYTNMARCQRHLLVPSNTTFKFSCKEFDIKCHHSIEYERPLGDVFVINIFGENYPFCESTLQNTMMTGIPKLDWDYVIGFNFSSDDQITGKGFNCEASLVHTEGDDTTTTTTTTTTSSTISTTSTSTTTATPESNNSTCICGRAKGDERIVGGIEAKPHNYPWQAALVYYGHIFCGATIISKKYVLTAAHCLKTFTYQVRVGEHDSKNETEHNAKDYSIAKIIGHPQYSSKNNQNDIALLELASEIVFSDHVRPACMPNDLNEQFVGEVGTVSGWGTLEHHGDQPDKLNVVNITIIDNVICNERYEGRIAKNMLCAQSPGKDSCQGDSGGPLVVDDVLVGVVSWGIGCARNYYPGVYARVTDAYDTFITKYAKDVCQKH